MDDGKLDNMAPLGRSVEDIERDEGNRVNPATPREDVRDDGIPDLPLLGGLTGTPVAAGPPEGILLGDEQGADTDREGGGRGDDAQDNDQT